MFLRLLINSLKILLKNKSLIFWTFLFPLILGTFFTLAFSNIESEEKLKVINVGIVNNDNFYNNNLYKSTFDYLSDENDSNRLFNIFYGTIDENKKKLEDNEIDGYLYIDENINVVIEKNGINQSIFKYVVEEISTSSSIIESIEIEDISNIKNDIMSLFKNEVNIKDTTNKNLSYTMIEFYSLIAMTCLYGAILSMYSINQVLPNMSSKGKRASISPIPKMKFIISSLCASYIIQVIGVILLFIYTVLVLNVDYGNNLSYVILLALIGSFAGLSLGIFISTILKTNENSKLGIIIAITMVFSFLSGMMGITMKYVIDKNIPILNKINPVNMITDGLYSLYYYETLNRYYANVYSLLIFSMILILFLYIFLRRQKYDSI